MKYKIWKKSKEIIKKNQILAPFLRYLWNVWEDFNDGNILETNLELKNKFKGKRCFLVLTGASLRTFDLSLLKNEYTFGCNFLYKHPKFSEVDFSFYTDVDILSNLMALEALGIPGLENIAEYFGNIEKASPNPNTLFFFRTDTKRFFKKNGLFRDRRVHYVKSLLPMQDAKIQINDLTNRITFLDGGVYFMMAAAIYMGFSELYLIGAGYTYSPIYQLHFYDTTSFPKTLSKEEIERKLSSLHPNTEVLGMEEDESNYYPRLVTRDFNNEKYKIAKCEAEKQGVRIINVVPDGFESPVFEKISMTDLHRLVSDSSAEQ